MKDLGFFGSVFVVLVALALGLLLGLSYRLFADTAFVVVPSGVGISAVDKIALDDSVLNMHQWVEQAIAGKISGCRERMIAIWYPRLLTDIEITSIPRSKDDLITLIASRSWYQNRATRDSIEALGHP